MHTGVIFLPIRYTRARRFGKLRTWQEPIEKEHEAKRWETAVYSKMCTAIHSFLYHKPRKSYTKFGKRHMTRNQTAGIVCYSIKNHELHLLLGREQYVHGWNCSHQWSEPGGHAKKIDQNNSAHTAIREFNEETLGVLPDVTELMKTQLYTARLNIHCHNRRKRGKTYYLLYVPDCPDIKTTFHIRREQLRGIQYTLQRLHSIQKQLISVGAPAPESPRRVNNRFQIIQDIVGFQEMSDQTCRVQVKSICPTDHVYFRYPKPDDSCIISVAYVDTSLCYASLYIRLLSLKQLLVKQLEALPQYLKEEAISIPKASLWLPNVRREFLEKDRLDWIRAQDVMDRIGSDYCRPGFELPVQLMLAHLAKKATCTEVENANCRRSTSPPGSPVGQTAAVVATTL